MPLGAYAEISGDAIIVRAIVVSIDGKHAAHTSVRGTATHPERAGIGAAEELLKRGAAEILDEVRRAQADAEGQPS
jgi:hydroxymethylbilane synthase